MSQRLKNNIDTNQCQRIQAQFTTFAINQLINQECIVKMLCGISPPSGVSGVAVWPFRWLKNSTTSSVMSISNLHKCTPVAVYLNVQFVQLEIIIHVN